MERLVLDYRSTGKHFSNDRLSVTVFCYFDIKNAYLHIRQSFSRKLGHISPWIVLDINDHASWTLLELMSLQLKLFGSLILIL